MTDKAKLRDSVKKNVRALLISAPMGLSMRELERDYAEVICDKIPALQLGFNSAQDLLLDMPDVARPHWERGNLIFFGVADSTTKHIQRLVSRQRKDKAKIRKKRAAVNSHSSYLRDASQPPRRKQPSSFSSRSFKAPAVKAAVPASLQSQVKLILKRYRAGISNKEFQTIFYQYQNYNINFRKLGFQNLWELLHAIPGVKASHTSKDEYDIFLVPENVNAIPAGYEEMYENVKETDFIHKGQIGASHRQDRKNLSETNRKITREPPPPRLSGQRMPPSNSRSPWALAGIPQPTKTIPVARGRGKNRNEPVVDMKSDQRRGQAQKTMPERGLDETSLPIEQDVEAPFEKEFVDDIKQILGKHPNGLWSIDLPDEYKKLTGKPLKFFDLGYFSVIELVSAMPDVIMVVREDTSDWKLYDASKSGKSYQVDPQRQIESLGKDEDSTLEEVKEKLRELLGDFQEGVLLEDLQTVYEAKYSRSLPLQKLGFHDVDSLVLLIPDVVRVVYRGPGKFYAFAESETQGIPKYDSRMAILCSLPQDAVGYGYKYKDPELPPCDQYFEVYVSSVCTPHKMTIQIRDKDQNIALEELMDDLESIYKYPEGERYFFPTSMIAVNQLCCALYLEDNNWHRGIITGVVDNDFVEVNYVDYGSTLQVPKSCLRLLKACFLKVPALAINAKLANVEPVQETWTAAARDRMLELTSEKPLIAYCQEIKSRVLSLFLCDTTTERDIHINDLLVQEGYAQFTTPTALQARSGDGDKGNYDDQPAFDPSDFVTTVEKIPGLQEIPADHHSGGNIPQSYPYEEMYLTPEAEFHQVTEAGEHKDFEEETFEEKNIRTAETDEEESSVAELSELQEEIPGESESDLEEMEEIEESNLNIEDILLTMKFLEGRRNRLLAVLSADDGVDCDDLDETETLIRHFEERKKKIAEIKLKEKAAEVLSVQPNEPSEPEAEILSSNADSQLTEDGKDGMESGTVSRQEEEEEDDHQQLEIEDPAENSPRSESSKVQMDLHEFPILESQETQQTIPEEMHLKPVVDPATLKDLGQMLRSSLKISAEPFRPKQTAAISPFRRPVATLRTSPSAFLDNRDSMEDVKGGYVSEAVVEEQIIDPSYNPGEAGLYQHQIHPFQSQKRYAPTYSEQQEFYHRMGFGIPPPQPQRSLSGNMPMNNPMYKNSGLSNPQLFEGPPPGNPVKVTDVPQVEPSKLNNPPMAFAMPGVSLPGMMQGGIPRFGGARAEAGVVPNMGSQMVRHQGVQQFYSGELDIRYPSPIQPVMRNPAPPMIRGMRVPGAPSVLRFSNSGPQTGPAFSINRPSNLNSMPFRPASFANIPGQGQQSLGGTNNMYSSPPPPFNMSNGMFPPNAMGRGMGRGPP